MKKNKRGATAKNSQSLKPPSAQSSVWGSWWFLLGIVCVLSVVVLLGIQQFNVAGAIPEIEYTLVDEHPHDDLAFTQGLVFHEGKLYESTGRYGESTLREIEIETGDTLRRVDIAPDLFAEGLCLWNDEWLQLTWKSNNILHYDRDTLEETRQTSWDRQGWGLTHNGKELIISDGTSRIFFVDPTSNKVVRKFDVMESGRRRDKINELEYIDGYLYANVWYKPYVLKINPANGKVVGKINLTGPIKKMGLKDRAEVCNGIAHDPASKHFYVTGKLWPKVLEIKLSR